LLFFTSLLASSRPEVCHTGLSTSFAE